MHVIRKPFLFLFFVLNLAFFACDSSVIKDATTPNKDTTSTTIAETPNITPRMEEIRQTLIGDWIEDSVEFKRVYKMAPPPVKNSRVRFQEDGWVYIPEVLLTKENWDRWEVANDTTLHIIKRQNEGVRVFIIDSLGKDALKYRLKLPQFERKIRLIRTNK